MERRAVSRWGELRDKAICSDDVHLSSRRDNEKENSASFWMYCSFFIFTRSSKASFTAVITKITASVFGCCFFVLNILHSTIFMI